MGRRPGVSLTRAQIAATALAILDEHGPDAVTMRAIAARLGVRSPSLYNHVRSKDEILDAVTEIIGDQIDRSTLDHPDWRVGMADFARSYRRAFREHPAALAVIARRAVETHQALSVYDEALSVWQRAGWSARDAMLVMGALEYLVLGSVLVPFTGGFVRPANEYSDAYPALAAALAATAHQATGDAEFDTEVFEVCLGVLIAGLDARLTRGSGLARVSG